jgi:hypothetical protein
MRKFTALLVAGIAIASMASPAAAAPSTMRGNWGPNGVYGSGTLEYNQSDGWVGHMRIEKLPAGGYHYVILTGISTNFDDTIDANLSMRFVCYVNIAVSYQGRYSCRNDHLEVGDFPQYPNEGLDMSSMAKLGRRGEPGARVIARLYLPNMDGWIDKDMTPYIGE